MGHFRWILPEKSVLTVFTRRPNGIPCNAVTAVSSYLGYLGFCGHPNHCDSLHVYVRFGWDDLELETD